MVEHRIAIAELHRAMPLLVVEDRARNAPGVAVVAGNDGVDAAHVGLARDAFLISHDKVLLLPQGDARLPKQGSARLLVSSADNAHVADIAGGWDIGDFVFAMHREQRQQQRGDECEDIFHGQIQVFFHFSETCREVMGMIASSFAAWLLCV